MPDRTPAFRRATCARPKLPGSSVSRAERWRSIGPTVRDPPIERSAVASSTPSTISKAWADRGTKTSTSDPGNGTVLPAKRHAAPLSLCRKARR